MTHVTLQPAFEELIDPDAPVSQIGTGFGFTEGPVWHPLDHYLLFSDMPGDVRRRWDEQQGVTEVRRPANKCNGMTYDAGLNLIVCEHATSLLVRERPDGRREVLASHFQGKELNSPNDVCVRSDGSIYFTDPIYGRSPHYGVERPHELGFQGVYRVPSAGGAPQLVVDDDLFNQPNGLCFSPDEKLLYVNDSARKLIRVFDVSANGLLANARIFASDIVSSTEPGGPDGMKCDERGNVWVTAPGGLWVYAPSGELVGKVRAPEQVANLAWGGPDFRTLFLTASQSVYRVETNVGPRREPYMKATAPGAASPEPDLLDPKRCALIIQDMQNDAVGEGGAFASSGAPAHAKAQNVVENIRHVAAAARASGVPVIHVWFIVEPGATGVKLNAPLFKGLAEHKAVVRGTWGAAPVKGLEPQSGDLIVEKMTMSAWEGTRLESLLKGLGRDTIIDTGAWTNMSIEHTARTGADKGYAVVVPEDCCSTMNAEWHKASIDFAMQNVATITKAQAVIKALANSS
ncbi:MAG TPA: isochorismatase family protein, partial [Roseiarcus sp.]